jgi:hypothetical protein
MGMACSEQMSATALGASEVIASHSTLGQPFPTSAADQATASSELQQSSERKAHETESPPWVKVHLLDSSSNTGVVVQLKIVQVGGAQESGSYELFSDPTYAGPHLPMQQVYMMLKDQMQDRGKGHFALFSDVEEHISPERFVEYGKHLRVPVNTSKAVSWQCFIGTVLHCLHR